MKNKIAMFFYCLMCIIFTALITNVDGQIQRVWAPYQVSIRLSDNKGPIKHLCSGVLIHRFYVLTTAHCLFYSDSTTHDRHQYETSKLYITAGFPDAFIERRVIRQIIHKSFSMYKEMENDVALLRLSSAIPEGNTDLKIVDLIENTTEYVNCFTSYVNKTVKGDRYIFLKPTMTKLKHVDYCKESSTKSRPDDLCSIYYFDNTTMCFYNNTVLKNSNDRGAGMLCNNRLVGLLSRVLPPINNKNSEYHTCTDTSATPVFYERIWKHMAWLSEIINGTVPTTKKSSARYSDASLVNVLTLPSIIIMMLSGMQLMRYFIF